MANVVADKLTQANQIKERIRTVVNAKNAGIPEGAPFADYPGYLEGLPEQVENMPIALDFSGGDMEIIAPDGVVVKSAVIQKPANLIPENIAEGVDIAGIVGALKAGGKIAFGSLTGAGDSRTIQHDLGVVPDVIYIWTATDVSSLTVSMVRNCIGISNALKSKLGVSVCQMICYKNKSAVTGLTTYSGGFESTSATLVISNATKNTFFVGNSTFKLYSGVSYNWLAIAGLT